MPATTRYSATFDRPYEEDDRPAPLGQPLQRRSRSLSLQAPAGTSLLFGGGGGGAPGQRSSSTDGGGAKEPAAGRTAAKAAVKAHSNPFQFVKVGTCPLYKKAEQQLKKVKEVKKSEVLQEEEEEWQSNLDSWKTRRRKMSEDVFKRQEEIKQFEVEEQENQISQKKTKTFSEMVESRATRGRALSLCLISSPLEFQDWEPNSRNGKKMCSVDNLFSGGSEESSNVNSEDETGVCVTQVQNNIRNGNTTASTNGTVLHQNGTSNHNNEESVAFKDDQGQCGNFVDSGLESISSHRAGDIPDSGSDFSQDSGGSMDCESPRVVTATSTGVAKLLEEFNSQSETAKQAKPVHNGVHVSTNGILPKKEDKLNTDKNTSVNGTKQNIDKRTVKESINGKSPKYVEENNSKLNKNCDEGVTQERSIESENEMYVDDFEELSRKVCLPLSAEISSAHSAKDLSSLPKPVNNSKASNEPPRETTASTNSNNRSLNIIYQSQNTIPNKSAQSPSTTVKNLPKTIAVPKSALKNDVPTVEKVAEEMEKMILEQLEEEEKAKELAAKVQSKDTVIAREEASINSMRQLNPPKEKPPPPPQDSETKKVPSLNRASSTKRIKKEIHKRRSNFLGIENEDENNICDGSSVPPPPALEDILKAEMEIDREGRKQIENAAIQRLSIEECEIMRKEREIIENLEIEERRKRYMGQIEDLIDSKQSIIEANSNVEAERIQSLKEERILNEEQKMRLEEERYLKEREEYIRKQEGDNTATLSSSLIPPDTTTSSTATAPTPDLPTSLTSTKPNTLLLEKGDGEIALSDSLVGSKSETAKPIVPPKPLKKKEVIRKERERLRQEQEALQREREEHRQKLLMEQELMKNAQKSHAVDACRLGPPPPAKPTFTPQLTPLSALPSNTATSRTHNGIPANTNSDVKRLPGHPSNRPSKAASSRSRATQNESWGQQKVPSAKKQNDSLTESRYNQNHWLLHEAEMRRLAELNDRQSQQTYHGNSSSQAHLPQDDACSNSRPKGPHINYAEHMWNYGGQPVVPTSNGPVVKYPAPVTGERAHVHVSYPRKPVLEPPTKPSRVVPMERQEHMLSVSGRKRCSHCAEELGRGAAMIIESLQLYYHIQCFQCCVCQAQLGNGSCGTDVRVRNNKLHCQNCYSNDEAGLKFSQV